MERVSNLIIACLMMAVIGACSPNKGTDNSDTVDSEDSVQDQFFANLTSHCGKGYNGKLVSNDEADADMVGLDMQIKFGPCSEKEIRIPFHVGDQRSRTWVVTRTDSGLRLKHRHAEEDGSEHHQSQYGGDTSNEGLATRQEFPVDQFSIDLFLREGLDVSITNVWTIEVTPEIYAYELNRENRNFRVEFDLKNPIDNVPDPW